MLDRETKSKRNRVTERTRPATSIQLKLLLFSAVLIIVPGVIFALIVHRSEQDSLQDLIGRHLAREAGQTAERLSGVLHNEREVLRSFARQDLMREVRIDDLDKRISLALATLRDGDAKRVDYLVVNRDRSVVASSNPNWIGPVPDWGKAVEPIWEQRNAALGPVALGVRSGEVLLLSAPVPDPDDPGNTLGSLIGVYDWDRLTQVTEVVRRELAEADTHTRVIVTDESGAIVGGTPLSPDEESEFPPGWLAPAAEPGRSSGYTVLPASGFLVGHHDFGLDEARWRLIVVERLADALAPTRQLTRRLGTILALTLILALALAAVGGGRVVKPLTELTRAIGSVSQGNLSSLRVAVRSEDEVGSLARAFNEMAEELEQAQSDLVEAVQYALVGEIAAGVAHEVRTSLGVMRSSTQILERSLPRDADPQAVELAQLIREEIDRLGGVVDDLLELGRPRAPHLEAIDLSLPVRRAVDIVEPRAAEKRVRLGFDDSETRSRVRCDPDLLYQVALNLLVNAIQAVSRNGRVAVKTVHTNDGYVGFEVRDDGPGIPEAIREKLFRPFVTGREGGIGLGLTFVQRVIYEHQGRILVESEPGRGACFRVELPADREVS